MSISMYPTIAAPERRAPDYVLQGKSETGSIQQGSVVVPGEIIFSLTTNLITGHGTYRNTDCSIQAEDLVAADSDKLKINSENEVLNKSFDQGKSICSSLSGRVRIVNKLVYVEPPKARYFGNVGDTVVGRIVEVEQRRWLVNINSSLLGNLALANVKLPGGELRRKSEDDERAMRSFMKEGDLIVAEVHDVYKNGTLQLHMPGTRTGKLGGGCLLRIPPSLIKRQKIHRHRLSIQRLDSTDLDPQLTSSSNSDAVSVGLILGCNGFVWIGPSRFMDIGLGLCAPVDLELDKNQADMFAERCAVCRVRNCILALVRNGIEVWETSILAACEASWVADPSNEDVEMQLDLDDHTPSLNQVHNRITRLLHPEVSNQLSSLVQAKLKLG